MKEKDKWIDDVLVSINNLERAKPSANLFARIENELDNDSVEVIPIYKIRFAAVAAAILLMFNVFSIYNYVLTSETTSIDLSVENNQELISNYNIYE